MRTIGTILRAVYVLLFLGLIYLWGRSSAGGDRVGLQWVGPGREGTLRMLISGRSSVGVFLSDGGPGAWYSGDGYSFTYSGGSGGSSAPDGFLGFRFEHQARTNPRGVSERWTYAMVPYALLVALAALPPALWARRWARMHRRLANSCCRTCGYDLRGLPHQCPECGEQIFPT